ncbi:hypothetical protein SSCG_00054 [Streptomyces clavuligerus]|nr:hypothetical protein SSCG_00054 [Streptomyces clavuligerus]
MREGSPGSPGTSGVAAVPMGRGGRAGSGRWPGSRGAPCDGRRSNPRRQQGIPHRTECRLPVGSQLDEEPMAQRERTARRRSGTTRDDRRPGAHGPRSRPTAWDGSGRHEVPAGRGGATDAPDTTLDRRYAEIRLD